MNLVSIHACPQTSSKKVIKLEETQALNNPQKRPDRTLRMLHKRIGRCTPANAGGNHSHDAQNGFVIQGGIQACCSTSAVMGTE